MATGLMEQSKLNRTLTSIRSVGVVVRSTSRQRNGRRKRLIEADDLEARLISRGVLCMVLLAIAPLVLLHLLTLMDAKVLRTSVIVLSEQAR